MFYEFLCLYFPARRYIICVYLGEPDMHSCYFTLYSVYYTSLVYTKLCVIFLWETLYFSYIILRNNTLDILRWFYLFSCWSIEIYFFKFFKYRVFVLRQFIFFCCPYSSKILPSSWTTYYRRILIGWSSYYKELRLNSFLIIQFISI